MAYLFKVKMNPIQDSYLSKSEEFFVAVDGVETSHSSPYATAYEMAVLEATHRYPSLRISLVELLAEPIYVVFHNDKPKRLVEKVDVKKS